MHVAYEYYIYIVFMFKLNNNLIITTMKGSKLTFSTYLQVIVIYLDNY